MSEALIHPNVELGAGVEVGPFCLLGRPPKGARAGELPLSIGAGSVIRSHTVIYAGTRIGERFQSGHNAMIRESTTIGARCSVGTGSVVEFKVQMGDGVRLHSQVFVPEYSVLEDGAWIGPNVVVTNAPYPTAARAKETLQGVRICRNARIGANSTLLPGVTIGEGALVGAGSVVTRDVAPFSIVAGNPATPRGDVRALRYRDTGAHVYPEEA